MLYNYVQYNKPHGVPSDTGNRPVAAEDRVRENASDAPRPLYIPGAADSNWNQDITGLVASPRHAQDRKWNSRHLE